MAIQCQAPNLSTLYLTVCLMMTRSFSKYGLPVTFDIYNYTPHIVRFSADEGIVLTTTRSFGICRVCFMRHLRLKVTRVTNFSLIPQVLSTKSNSSTRFPVPWAIVDEKAVIVVIMRRLALPASHQPW